MSTANETDTETSRRHRARDIDVVIVNYNGLGTVLETIGSVLGFEDVRAHVIVVDDGSTDGSPEAIAEAFPDAAIYREPKNTKAVNRLRNVGLAEATADRVLVIDNDVRFDPSCAAELLRAMDSDERVALCIPRMMYAQDESLIYMAGGHIHYVGAIIAPGRHERYDGRTEPLPRIGGGIALFDRHKLAHVGGFDEDYVLAWGDDAELHQRLLLAGYRSLYVPTAVCMHEYKAFDASRHYRVRGQVRNRWRYLLTHYELRTLLLASPALLVYELMQALFLIAKGLPRLYVLGTGDALRALPATLRRRREVQALRRVPDREVLFAGSLYVRPEHGGRAGTLAVGALSRAFSMYWSLIRPLLSGRSAREPRAALARR